MLKKLLKDLKVTLYLKKTTFNYSHNLQVSEFDFIQILYLKLVHNFKVFISKQLKLNI